MKKLMCLAIAFFCLCQSGFRQEKYRYGRLERTSDSIFIVDGGRRYLLERSTITVKLKPGVEKIGGDVKILRSNRLGFMHISVPEDVDIESFVSNLERTGDFDVVEYNSFGKYCSVPNDTHILQQWHLNSVDAFSAWGITMGSASIIVAIIDAGIDRNHQDIGYGTDGYSNFDETIGWDFYRGIAYARPDAPLRNCGHGTKVAGVLGAKTNNSKGIAGISGGNNSSGVTMMSLCVGDWNPVTSYVGDAIIHAVDHGARVIQLSLNVGRTLAIDAAIDYAVQNNVVIVCSTGSTGLQVDYPAMHDDVIAVGAIDQYNERLSSSNYGTDIDVVAPGVGIYTTFSDTQNPTKYDFDDGTSFSSPIVSGIAALLLSIRPDLTPVEVRLAIESTCQKINKWSPSNPSGFVYTNNPSVRPNGEWNNEVGYGLVDAYAALTFYPPVINGSKTVCTSETFSISTGNNASWTVPSGFSANTLYGKSIIVTATGLNGQTGTLSAIVNGTTIYKSIQACSLNLNTVVISGPTHFCSTGGTYSIANWNPDWTVSWTVKRKLDEHPSASAFATEYYSTSSITLSKNNNTPEAVNLSAVIKNKNGTIVKTCNFYAAAGPFSPWTGTLYWTSINACSGELNGYYANGVLNMYAGEMVDVSMSYYVANSWNFYYSPEVAHAYIRNLNGDELPAFISYDPVCHEAIVVSTTWWALPESGYLYISLRNACGSSSEYFAIPFELYEYSPSSAYPNPTSSTLNVELNRQHYSEAQAQAFRDKYTGGKATRQSPTYDIRLYDGQGNMLRQTFTKGNKVEFNVANLPNGIYYLHIYDGVSEKPEIRQIMVRH